MSFETILNDVAKGTFIATLSDITRLNELSRFSADARQTLIFRIAKILAKDKKQAREIFAALKEKFGSSFFEVSRMTSNAFHLAARENCDKDVIDLILELRIDINQEDHVNLTPINWAIRQGNETAFNALIDAGAWICRNEWEARPREDLSIPPLSFVIQNAFLLGKEKTLRMIKKLLAAGANPNIIEFGKYFPIFMETFGLRGSPFNEDLAKFFLSSEQVDLTTNTRMGGTVLDIACEGKMAHIAAELVREEIRNRFAKRFVGVEKEILETLNKVPTVLGRLMSEYECADDKFLQYTADKYIPTQDRGKIHPSLTFLFNITEEPRFKEIVIEQRVALTKAQKPSSDKL